MCTTMFSQYSHNVFCTQQCPQCAQQCPHNVLTMSSGAWSNVITHTSHSSVRLKRRFCLVCFAFVFVFVFGFYLCLCQACICICVRFVLRTSVSVARSASSSRPSMKRLPLKILKIFIVQVWLFVPLKIHYNQYAFRCGSVTSL